jgi:gliding motility-associated-like protein
LPLVVSLAVTNISCYNANDGAILATVTGGTPNYQYNWNPPETGSNPTGLAGGLYQLTVTDASNCTTTASATVINPQPLTVTFNIKNALCFNDSNGAIYPTVSGGFPGYTFQWSNGYTTQDITGLAGGVAPSGDTYVLSVTDSHNCNVVDSAVVFQPGALYTSGIIHNVSCHDNCDGSIITTPYGGTVPYAFTWSNNETTENIVQLCGGNYTLTLTDANQCSVVSLYIVDNPAQLTLTVLESNNSCFQSCNGTVVGIPGGGTPPYTYLWNNFVSDSLQSNVCAGFYTMVLTDSNGCRAIDTGTVSQPAPINITGAVTNILCNGASTGAINTTVTGGTLPYGFAWSNSATTQNISGLDSNTYVLTVTDANNCIQSSSFNLSQPTAISSAVSFGKPLCHGGGNGFVSVDVTGGTEPYTYGWSTSPPQFGATAANLYAGNYTLTITDNSGCSATVAATLSDPDPIAVNTNIIGSKCFNSATGGVVASVTSGGTPPYTYLVDGQLQATDTFSHLLPGTYTLIVIDANGCQGTATFTVVSPPPLAVTLAVNPSDNGQYILTGMNTQLTATATPDTGIIHYFWTPDTLMQFTGCADSTDCSSPYAAPTSTTTFMVTVENSDSCFVSDTITIYVDNQPASFIPTAFTPNGDGLNDRFEFAILGAQTIEISIFDRWGQRVYYNPSQTNGITNADGWDGTVSGKAAPEATYVYQMKVTYFDGTVKNRAGTVNVLR